MDTASWKSAAEGFAAGMLGLLISRIPWEHVFFADQPVALIQSERVVLGADGDVLARQIDKKARTTGYVVREGLDTNGLIHAQIRYGSCLLRISQITKPIYQFDLYANGKATGDCARLTRRQLLR